MFSFMPKLFKALNSSGTSWQLSGGLKNLASKAGKKFEKELKAGVMKKVGASTEGIDTDLGGIDSLLNSKQKALSGISTDFKPASSVDGLKKMFKF